MADSQMAIFDHAGMLLRTMPCPVPPAGRDGLRGARRAASLSSGPAGPITGQRRVSSWGGIQVVCQKIQVGVILAGDDTFRLVIDGETVAVASRAASSEIHRYKAYATLPRKAVTRCPKSG